ncbi:uncharacterized protein V6R79_003313 [Siganus canaliculatus]
MPVAVLHCVANVASHKLYRGLEKEGSYWACRWMDVEEHAESGELQSSSIKAPAVDRPQPPSWSHALKTLRPCRRWYSLAAVGAVWSVCQVEAPLHSSSQVDVCCRLALVWLLWLFLGGCVHALKRCLRPEQEQGEPLLEMQQEVTVAESRNNQYFCMSTSPDHHSPLALALADSLLLCVLQEPLSDPSLPHIKNLVSTLESVSKTLNKAHNGPRATPEESDQDSALTEKVKLIRDYLQQRMKSLHRLVQVQGDFEASVKDVLQGLEGLWAQLEELHTGVTLTKEESQGHRDVASAQKDTATLFAVLGHYRNRLQSCQAHLKDATQMLQELTWSHAHISNSVSCSSESVWPELLLQTNIEQFDKVQESFLSLEQQTTTFQAHLEGLGNQNQSSPHLHNTRTSDDVSLEVSSSNSASSVDVREESEKDKAFQSLCERSALHFSSTFGRMRKSGRRK